MSYRALALFIPFLGFLASHSVGAQDYPYDDTPASAAKPTAKTTSASEEIPRESPDAKDEATGQGHHLPPLFRVSVKGGAEFTTYQSLDSITGLSTTLRGPGFSGLLSLGWDLPYQPIFIEVETGYRALLTNRPDRLQIIPFQVGIYRRVRSGPHNLIKFGLTPSLDLRMAKQSNGTTGYSLIPSLAFNIVFEIERFLIQPGFTLYRLHTGDNFVSFGALAGYRF